VSTHNDLVLQEWWRRALSLIPEPAQERLQFIGHFGGCGNARMFASLKVICLVFLGSFKTLGRKLDYGAWRVGDIALSSLYMALS
jgi:hypothetical protein